MARADIFWIKERYNPQFPNSYFIAMGKRTLKYINTIGEPRHGSNTYHRYDSKEEYEAEVKRLQENGRMA